MSQITSPREASVTRAGAIYSMSVDRSIYRAIAVRDEWIVAVSEDPHGLDGLMSADTRVIDEPDLTILPAFDDTHNHFILAAENLGFVQADQAHSIADLLELIRQRAAHTPAGQWIRTSTTWDESNLAEKRLPTASVIRLVVNWQHFLLLPIMLTHRQGSRLLFARLWAPTGPMI